MNIYSANFLVSYQDLFTCRFFNAFGHNCCHSIDCCTYIIANCDCKKVTILSVSMLINFRYEIADFVTYPLLCDVNQEMMCHCI